MENEIIRVTKLTTPEKKGSGNNFVVSIWSRIQNTRTSLAAYLVNNIEGTKYGKKY